MNKREYYLSTNFDLPVIDNVLLGAVSVELYSFNPQIPLKPFQERFLVIVPEYNIVAVRCADPNGFNYDTDFYTDFVSLISKLGK